MQEQQRFVNFIVASMVILWVWSLFIAPKLFPPPPKAIPPKAAAKKDADIVSPDKGPPKPAAGKNEKPVKAANFPHREDVFIGSDKFESGYRLLVKFDSKGAVVSEIQLIDPRYHDLDEPKKPLSVIQNDPKVLVKTLQTDVPAIDDLLKPLGKSLKSVDWELVKGEQAENHVTWRYIAPDESLEIRKKYTLEKAPAENALQEFKAYGLGLELTLKNLEDKPQKVHYEMYGPVGMPVENRYYTQKTRDVAVGFLSPTGTLTPKLVTAVTMNSNQENHREEEWKTPLKYAGVDLQYFAALIIPQADQNQTPYFSSSRAVFADEPPANGKEEIKYRNVTVKLTSVETDLAAHAESKHQFLLFTGPKRDDLVRPLGVAQIVDYGWLSGTFQIPQTLLWLLSLFQQGLSFLPWPYGWSIILLTIVVRSGMFPLSRKQALSAARMQELQPELALLKEKYKNTPEKFAKAQMELFNKNNCNPLSGCLPMLIQLPIFLGLYHAFNISVEMRGAHFLWINNLAAPDSLFKFGFNLPFLGPSFNLLPIITVCLFLVQQKLLMPPPTTPEAEMQQKMMFYMTIFMGYMFYSVAAGLCVYFIASSLWGVAERKLLPKKKPAGPGQVIQATAVRV